MFRSRALWLLLAVGLALRLAYGLAQDPLGPYGQTGGDDPWYLANAKALVTDAPLGTVVNGISTYVALLNQPPVFFIAAGIPQALLPPGPAVVAIRIVHALATTAVALFACGLAVRLVEGRPGSTPRSARRAGLLAAAALALSPALILEAAQVKTESLFVFFVTGGLWAYVEAVVRERTSPPAPSPTERGRIRPSPSCLLSQGEGGRAVRWFILAGVLLGLATLTRAVFLAFPLALAGFTPFALGWRPGWKKALLLLAVYAAVVGSWTVYNLARYQRLIIAGSGLPAFLYHGATGWDDADQVEQRLAETLGPAAGGRDDSAFLDATGAAIGTDPAAYLAHRLGELGGALLQPHNVEVFAGESLRAILTDWWSTDRTPGGLAALVQGDHFWPKLLLYVIHYTGLLLGAVGVWLTWRSWRASLPMLGYIAYTLLVHLFLLALPRYVFPITPLVWVFAAGAASVLSRKY